MPVQLLPFQKLVDMPNMAQRHRRTICGLAIASIVLIFIILNFLAWAVTFSFGAAVVSNTMLFTFAGIPSMVIIAILVCTGSYISLRNTDKWASTDTCCNLTRSHPTCCTKRCASNKHCCARMSCLHIAASVWTSLFCVLLVVSLFTGCKETQPSYRSTPDYPRDYGYNSYASTHHYYNIEPEFSYYSGHSYHGPDNGCEWLAGFEVPALVLMFCLAIITARSACLLRAIEQEMPQIEPLPAGKMVVLACPDTVEVTPAPTEAVCVAMGEGNSTADVKTEQADV